MKTIKYFNGLLLSVLSFRWSVALRDKWRLHRKKLQKTIALRLLETRTGLMRGIRVRNIGEVWTLHFLRAPMVQSSRQSTLNWPM